MTKIVHALIAKTAKEMCAEFYESAAHTDVFYKMHPSLKHYVRNKWRFFIGYAREALVTMLSGPYPDQMKEPIYEALCIDGVYKAPAERPGGLIH